MATPVYYTVNPDGGGDYLSLNAAFLGLNAINWIANDTYPVIRCTKTVTNDTTSAATGTGWLLDSTHQLYIEAATGHEASYSWSTSKYALVSYYGEPGVLRIQQNFINVKNIQIQCTNSGGNHTCIAMDASYTQCIVEGCFIKNGDYGISYAPAIMRNNIIYNPAKYGLNQYYDDIYTHSIHNNTFVGGLYAIYRNDANGTTSVLDVKNCYAGNQSTDAYLGTMTRTTCAHSSATVFSGSTASVPYDGTTFNSVTANSEDFRLITGALLIDVGTTIAAFAYDLINVVRPQGSAWDIGALEYSPPHVILDAGGIASNAAMGTLVAVLSVIIGSGTNTITDSASAVTSNAQVAQVSGIASNAAIGTPTVSIVDTRIHIVDAGGIASSAAIGTPTVSGSTPFIQGAPTVYASKRNFMSYARKR